MNNPATGTLHILPRSPDSSAALSQCCAICRPGDSLLFIEDGVLAAAFSLPYIDAVRSDVPTYALQADCAARGLLGRYSPRVQIVNDAGFVDLIAAHQRSITWS